MRQFTPKQRAIFLEVAKSKDRQLEISVASRDWKLRKKSRGRSPKDLNAADALVARGYLELLEEKVFEHRFFILSNGDQDARRTVRVGIGPKGLEYLDKLNK